jgi:hypothetical protein
MSKLETPMTRWYWSQVGGTLIEEFVAVKAGGDRGRRVLDAVIIKDAPFERVSQGAVSLKGKDIIVVQTKAMRLGMYLMGQALFSARLMERFGPRSIESIALCSRDDAELRPLFEAHPNMRVVMAPTDITLPSSARVIGSNGDDPTDQA